MRDLDNLIGESALSHRAGTNRTLLITLCAFASVIWSHTAQAQACVDSDGDGWGWDGSQSCRVGVQATPAASSAATGSGACVDTDGDGFGWDGQASCLVNQSQPVQQVTPANNAPISNTPENNTEASCVDPDGDGWGWNGVASCRVDSTAASGSTAPAVSSPQPAGNSQPISTGSTEFNRNTDLIALHFDHAPDRDDGHAAVAGLMVTERLGLNVQVVAGAYGLFNRDRYVPASEALMSTVWGSNWLNAHSNRSGSVSAAVNRWSAVLGAGGTVWVAEGGQADFTAAVVRQIQQLHSEFDTRQRIRVVQHSQWNEDHATPADLSFVQSNTRYIRIDDGNNPNGTADLRFESHNNGDFVARARSGRYANEWNAAFNYLSPSDKLDFSDTVELLHILGIDRSQIADVNDFGDFFF